LLLLFFAIYPFPATDIQECRCTEQTERTNRDFSLYYTVYYNAVPAAAFAK
jgi:hypothetical protein